MKAIAAAVCLCGWLGMACQAASVAPTAAPPSTAAPPLPDTRRLAPGPLTDAQAIVLIREELSNHGVGSDALSARISGDLRRASIRYSSSYAVDGPAFRPQMMLIALASARVVARVDPRLDGGMRLAAMPGGESNVGLAVITVEGSTLSNWASGSMSDQEFVSQWTEGVVTRE